jgi:hypothetical protein
VDVTKGIVSITSYAPWMLVAPDVYPEGLPVGNAAGGVESYNSSTNLWPWCVDPTLDTKTPVPSGFPTCPPEVLLRSHPCASEPADTKCFEDDAANRWAVRGAINAGLAIFLYAQSIETTGPAPDFDQCNLAPGSKPK